MAPTVSERIFDIWDSYSGKEVQKEFQEWLAEDTVGLTNAEKGQVTTQLARSIGLQNKFDEANKLLDEALGVHSEESSKVDKANLKTNFDLIVLQLRVALERGRVHNSSGHPALAIPYFQSVFDQASATTARSFSEDLPERVGLLQYLSVDALHMLAIATTTVKNRADVAAQALAICEQTEDERTRSWAGPILNNLAWDAMDERRFDDAVVLFKEAMALRKAHWDEVSHSNETGELHEKKKQRIFTAYKIARWSVGHAQMKGGNIDEALETLDAILRDGADGPSIRQDLAVMYADRGQSIAAEHAAKALEHGLNSKHEEIMRGIIKRFDNNVE